MTKRADKRKFHYIYKTTCIVNNKYYYGMHSTDNLDDGYLGSGTLLAKSISRYGRENFSLEILEFLSSRENLKLREQELINEEIIKDPMCMNLALGGDGGWDQWNAKLTPEQRTKLGQLGGFANRHLWSEETRKRVSNNQKNVGSVCISKAWETKFEHMSQANIKARIAATSKENIAKRKETFSKINHQKGSNNSQFGTCWVSSTDEVKKIKSEELEVYLADGFVKGRKLSK